MKPIKASAANIAEQIAPNFSWLKGVVVVRQGTPPVIADMSASSHSRALGMRAAGKGPGNGGRTLIRPTRKTSLMDGTTLMVLRATRYPSQG